MIENSILKKPTLTLKIESLAIHANMNGLLNISPISHNVHYSTARYFQKWCVIRSPLPPFRASRQIYQQDDALSYLVMRGL
jgi:hypothetical protein